MKKPIIGQEAVVPGYGLGRVVKIHKFDQIEVHPYVCDYPMVFDEKNVKLVKINYEEE